MPITSTFTADFSSFHREVAKADAGLKGLETGASTATMNPRSGSAPGAGSGWCWLTRRLCPRFDAERRGDPAGGLREAPVRDREG